MALIPSIIAAAAIVTGTAQVTLPLGTSSGIWPEGCVMGKTWDGASLFTEVEAQAKKDAATQCANGAVQLQSAWTTKSHIAAGQCLISASATFTCIAN